MSHASPIHRGRVSDKGLLVLDDIPRWRAFLSRLHGKPVEIIVRQPAQRRSNNQNRWYRGVIVPYVAEYLSEATGRPISSDQAHELLKKTFLGTDKTPLGEVIRSTAVLDVERFSNYCTQIQTYAASEWGLTIPSPGDVLIEEREGVL